MMKNLEPMTGPRQPVFGSDMKNHEENFIVRMWLLVKPVRKLVEYVVKMMNLMNLRTDRINCRIVIGLERPLIDRLNDAIGRENKLVKEACPSTCDVCQDVIQTIDTPPPSRIIYDEFGEN